MKLINNNKKAYYNYEIVETLEAGMVLQGPEIKSLRKNGASIQESYITFVNNEAFILNMHITPYEFTTYFQFDPLRTKKLLLHTKQLRLWKFRKKTENLTIIPLKLYFETKTKKGLVKLEIGLARGKKHYDKRETVKKRQDNRLQNKILKKHVNS